MPSSLGLFCRPSCRPSQHGNTATTATHGTTAATGKLSIARPKLFGLVLYEKVAELVDVPPGQQVRRFHLDGGPGKVTPQRQGFVW